MMKKILIAVAVVVVALVAFIATRPSTFRVERSTTVAAAAEFPFAQVNDFHDWGAWSPWEKLDPSMQKTFEGPASGEGAKYSWAGNDKVGKGSMKIVASRPNEAITLELQFIEPWAATNTTEFTFQPDGAGTKVTWAMSGENSFMAKAFSLVMNMDEMIGKDFEQGLADLKKVSEAAAAAKKAADEKAQAEATAAAAAATETAASSETAAASSK